jgi:iron complex outermembrane receptor protein
MRRAGGVGVVARFGATLLGGVALLAWFELPARSQTSQGSNSLPPVTVDAPAQQSLRRAPAKRNDARLRSTSRRTAAPGIPQPEPAAVQPQPSQPGVVPAFAGGQVAQGARLGMLGNTSTMTSPFNVTSYTDKFIRDQQAATGADALILDPSVRSTHPTGGIVDSFNIRGFPINEGNNGEFAFEGLYGIAPSYRIFTDYVERIEVLKGPSAALSGIAPNGGVGGVINVVPKRAGEDLTRLTASYGSTSRLAVTGTSRGATAKAGNGACAPVAACAVAIRPLTASPRRRASVRWPSTIRANGSGRGSICSPRPIDLMLRPVRSSWLPACRCQRRRTAG